MPFSEELKFKVKKKAAFRCCRCQNIGVEIHHIIPESENGPSNFENAAPLCPSCHANFGDNAKKRKELRQMRDWWYEKAETMFNPTDISNPFVKKIDDLVVCVQKNESNFFELKETLKAFCNSYIENLTPSSSVSASTSIVNSVMPNYSHLSFPSLSAVGEGTSTIMTVNPRSNVKESWGIASPPLNTTKKGEGTEK